MRRLTLFFSFVLLLTCGQALAQGIRIDGNWWRGQSPPEKLVYIFGYWDGQAAASQQSAITGFIGAVSIASAPKLCKPLLQKMQDDYNNRPKEPDITSGQLRDGVDNFYTDYKNRLILVAHALLVVNREVTGTSDDEITKLKEAFRKIDSE